MRRATRRKEELPLDNTARVVLFDAMGTDGADEGLSREELFSRVITRLRVLVPRELHVAGEQRYVEEKVQVCVQASLLAEHPRRPEILIRGLALPRIRYPDGTIRDYTPGLEAARERLDAADAKLRQSSFDFRRLIPSLADKPKSEGFRALVASMREHGYLDQFPVTESGNGQLVDGRARWAAATEANITLKRQHRVPLRARRDTPLHHVLFALDVNAARLSDEHRSRVHEAIADRTGRPWAEIRDDLDLTRDWRSSEPKAYDAQLAVKLVPFGDQRDAKVQVTTDGTRVMLRSVMQQAGLASYNYKLLKHYVPMEEARSQYSGKKAIFVRIDDAIAGIARMQHDRDTQGLKVDKAWDDIRHWLVEAFQRDETVGDLEVVSAST